MKSKIILLSSLALSCFFFDWFFTKLIVTETNSVHYRVFWKTNETSVIKNDYVHYENVTELLAGKGVKSVIKQVGCSAGNNLSKQGHLFRCDGMVIAETLEMDGKGNPLPRFTFNGLIPDGYMFLIGDHDRSFDSRYFGLVATTKTTKVIPLL